MGETRAKGEVELPERWSAAEIWCKPGPGVIEMQTRLFRPSAAQRLSSPESERSLDCSSGAMHQAKSRLQPDYRSGGLCPNDDAFRRKQGVERTQSRSAESQVQTCLLPLSLSHTHTHSYLISSAFTANTFHGVEWRPGHSPGLPGLSLQRRATHTQTQTHTKKLRSQGSVGVWDRFERN